MIAKKFMDGLCAEQQLEFNEKVFSGKNNYITFAITNQI